MHLNDFGTATQRTLLATLLCFFMLPQSALGHGDEAEDGGSHSESDAYWAALAQDYEPFAAAAQPPPEPEDLITTGSWGPVLSWPHIPVSAASLPDGRILTYASNQPTTFPSGPEFTYAAVWDPVTENIQSVNHTQHDMFCSHLVMLEDGSVFVNGGRNTVDITSIFDFQTDQWSLGDSMNRGRWYPTTIHLPDGGVFTALGSGGENTAEVWRPGLGWQDLAINLASMQAGVGFERHWWPHLHVDPKGRVIHTGPVRDMHRIDPYGSGAVENLGPWLPTNIWYSKHAAVTMYDIGKVIIAGGDSDGADEDGSTNRVLTVDLNGATPLPVEVTGMLHNRRFANAVMLPDGRVLVVGGNTSGEKFNDSGTVLTPEIWDPATDSWTEVADMAVPRNYHSVALLLTDGRVFSAGGGLCGCAADHSDAQVYSPPYLFAADGTPALRPNVVSVPASVRNGEVFAVTASAGIDRFTMIKMSATTHAVNTDLRFLEVPFSDEGGGVYHLTAHPSRDVALPGYWLLFGLSGGVPSVGQAIQFSTANVPSLVHPGPIRDVAGEPVARQFVASDPNGDAITFGASGLPPGLSLDPSTGWVTGTLPANAEGSYEAVIDVQDAAGGPTVYVTWTVLPEGLGSGSILREWWLGISGNAISSLTGAADYPSAPDGSDHPNAFEAPTNWADSYGTRMRGYVHPPLTGNYRFYIASDDNGELWLSTDTSPSNAALIATVPAWSSSREWTKFPGDQDSSLIGLVAGQPYYIEALQKEGGGGDNLAVAWEIPGSSLAVIDGLYLTPFDSEPSLNAVPAQVSGEGDTVALQIVATHPAGLALTFGATGLPPGADIDAGTGLISGTLTMGSAGGHAPEVTALDELGGSDATSFDWTVTASVCGNAMVEAGEDCDGGPCCTACSFDAPGTSCDDGNACTGADQCDGTGSCSAGAPLACDDGIFCNGSETCDTIAGCQPGTPPTTDDGVSCTDDSCDETSDTVLHLPQDDLCDDGFFCNGAELCDALTGCGSGSPPLLDDGIDCTVDSCDEVADLVVHAPMAALCEDADICTTFVCDPLTGCLDAGPPPEHAATCEEAPAVPSLPPWGLGLTTLIMVAGGSAGLWRARRVRSRADQGPDA